MEVFPVSRLCVQMEMGNKLARISLSPEISAREELGQGWSVAIVYRGKRIE